MKKSIWIILLLLVGVWATWFWGGLVISSAGVGSGGVGGVMLFGHPVPWFTKKSEIGAAPSSGRGRGPGGGFMGPVPVVAALVKSEDVPIFLDGLGTVQAFNSVTVRPRVDGQLDQIFFKEGEEVKAGTLLAVIDPRPFQSQVGQAEAKKRQDEAQLSNAQAILARNTELLKKGAIDRQTFDTSRFQADQLQAAVQADQAALENAQTQLGYTQIKAPIEGRVGVRQVDAGNLVRANDPNGLVVITQLQPISVVFTLPETNLQPVLDQSGNGETLAVRVLDRSNTKILGEGTLAVIDNQIDPGTGTVKLKATFPNKEQRLWPGQFVNARLLLTTKKNGMVIPTSAVQRGPNGTYVYVISAEKTAEMRPVKVLQSEANQALIDDGLQQGEQVVIDGQYKLQPGAQVELAGTAPSAGKPGSQAGNQRGGEGHRGNAARASVAAGAAPSGQ